MGCYSGSRIFCMENHSHNFLNPQAYLPISPRESILSSMHPTRTILVVIAIGLLTAAAGSFYNFYILRNYMIFAAVPCDSALHSCFIGDGVVTPTLYQKVYKKAYLVPACDAWAGKCPELDCTTGNGVGCVTEYCPQDSAEDCSTKGNKNL